MKEKLGTELASIEIKQTRHQTVEASATASASPGSRVKIEPIRFKQDAVNKVRKENYGFGKQKHLYIPFKVSRDTHQKGAVLKILKGRSGDRFTEKVYYIRFWFNNKSHRHWIGKDSQMFGVKECNDYLIELHKTHVDPKTLYWIKDPNETAKNNKRIMLL